ncbi:UxaA family hydrolase [uncultured Sphaerochaeta sp.]|uniref:UxaA family hydrolase n=1 Tax=uncultured Sphaerochaeta sp. TaxID=886478 RepID=UPI0029CA9F1E|nr:UxaA family hydrolase [uncultured Sphaerochaeta sp.]
MNKGKEMEFLGYKRAEGRAGVRNHVLILPTCGCSSETARIVASQVQGSINVIINTGCADVEANTELTQRVLTGFALHPNVYAVVIIGLGCETVGHDELHKKLKAETSKPIVSFGIQEEGGTAKTIAKAVPAARALVSEASAQSRVPCPISDLLLGLECGGSDATSGIAANPALGEVCDTLIDLGASTMLSETIEFIGAEHILANRAINKEVHNQIIQICRDYEEHLAAAGQDCRAGQPTPGNKEGGLSTLEEKSLGCIKKGGTRPIVEVLQEGVRPTKSGSLIMDTPGYDVASVTMMVAGGCQLVAFTTGRGTPTGIALAPVLKITGNRETYHHMEDNMDVDVSGITEGEYSISDGAERIFNAIVESANGRMTKAEVYGFSDICIDHICRFV